MRLGDVVDQFLDEHGLADAGAAEQADLAAFGVGSQQVDDLDAGDEDFGFRRLLGEGGSRLVDGAGALGLDGTGFVDRLADDVEDAAERLGADRHGDRLAGIADVLAADEALGGVHGDAAHGVLTEVLSHFQHHAGAVVGGLQRVQDLRQVIVELDVDNSADDLGDAANGARSSGRRARRFLRHDTVLDLTFRLQSASAPEMISMSSLVIIA